MASDLITRRGARFAIPCLLATLAGCASSPAARLSDLARVQQHADAAYAKHDWRVAAGAYLALTQAVPDNAGYWFRLGNSYAHLDRPQPAADAYRAALQRNPRLPPAWHNLGSVLLKQAQAAYGQAAAHAKPGDPLKAGSTRLAARIRAVRTGGSGQVRPAPAVSAQAQAATVVGRSADTDSQGGGT